MTFRFCGYCMGKTYMLILLVMLLSCDYGKELLRSSYGKLFVLNVGKSAGDYNSVVVIDVRDKKILEEIELGSLSELSDIAINPISRLIYVSDATDSTVRVIDGDSLKIIRVVSGFGLPRGMEVNVKENKIYVADEKESKVIVMDVDSYDLEAVSVDIDMEPRGLAVNSKTGVVHVFNKGDVVKHKIGTYTIVSKGVHSPPSGVDTRIGEFEDVFIAVNPNTNKIYLNNETGNSVVIFSEETNNRKEIDGFNGPWGIGVSEKRNKVYVANKKSNSVVVLDGETDEKLKVIINISDPRDVSVNDSLDEVYITAGKKDESDEYGSANIFVVSSLTDEVIWEVSGFRNPRGIGYLP